MVDTTGEHRCQKALSTGLYANMAPDSIEIGKALSQVPPNSITHRGVFELLTSRFRGIPFKPIVRAFIEQKLCARHYARSRRCKENF